MGGTGRRQRGAARSLVLTVALVCVAAAMVSVAGQAAAGEPADGDTARALPDTNVTRSAVARPHEVRVYYFHRTLRCDTCLKFEAYTDEAIRAAFPDELTTGILKWQVVNLDDPASEHLVDDYHITESSVVLVEFRDGVQQGWANLDAIWGFVRDKPTFLSYIQSEVGSRLDAALEPAPAHGDSLDSVEPGNETPTGR